MKKTIARPWTMTEVVVSGEYSSLKVIAIGGWRQKMVVIMEAMEGTSDRRTG